MGIDGNEVIRCWLGVFAWREAGIDGNETIRSWLDVLAWREAGIDGNETIRSWLGVLAWREAGSWLVFLHGVKQAYLASDEAPYGWPGYCNFGVFKS